MLISGAFMYRMYCYLCQKIMKKLYTVVPLHEINRPHVSTPASVYVGISIRSQEKVYTQTKKKNVDSCICAYYFFILFIKNIENVFK